MRRFLEALLSDWPLKLGALGLATALYIGLSFSQNIRTWPGDVPIEVLDPPRGAAVLDLPGTVSEIEYRAPLDAAVTLANGSFLASIDLSDVVPTAGGEPVAVPVRVIALDPRVQVVVLRPRVGQRARRHARHPPHGHHRGPWHGARRASRSDCPVVSPASAVLRGASSRVGAVQAVVARVAVDASGLNIDQDVDLEAVDETGAVVPGVEVLPERAHVSIEVARELAYATLPVVPVVTGSPAPGYRLVAVAAVPTTLTVSGEASAVTRLTSVPTQPVDITGLTDSLEASVEADLPADVSLGGGGHRPGPGDHRGGGRLADVAGGRPAAGARPAGSMRCPRSTVQVTFGGPCPVLDSLDPATIVAAVEVGELRSAGMRWR